MIAFGLAPEPVKAYLDRVLAENKELKADNARLQIEIMSLKALIQQLLARIEALENGSGKGSGRPPANSENSSVPPSKDPIGFERGKDRKGRKDKKTSQKRKGHNGGNQRRLLPDTEKLYPPERCPDCGGTHFVNLKDGTPIQQVELKAIQFDVTDHVPQSGTCSSCGRKVKGDIPEGCQYFYGPRFTSFVASLVSRGVPRRVVEDRLRDKGLFVTSHGEPVRISQGGIQRMLDRSSAALRDHYDALLGLARIAPVNHIDETGWRLFGPQGRIPHLLWVMTSELVTTYMIHEERSGDAFQELRGTWFGYLISDDYNVYVSWPQAYRQTCLSHLIRAAKRLAEDARPDIAKCGRSLLSALCRLTKWQDTAPSEAERKRVQGRLYNTLLENAESSDESGVLCRRLLREWDCLFTFFASEHISATNNQAERQIWAAVVRRKVSFGSTAEKGFRWLERHLSVLQTCLQNGWSFFELLRDAIVRSITGQAQELTRYDVIRQHYLKLRDELNIPDSMPLAEATP